MRGSRRPDSGNRVIAPKKWHSSKPQRLPGPTVDEMTEFERLDALPPFDDNGQVAWTFEGQPTNGRERRWLELYAKIEPIWTEGKLKR
jgi:hypothetical protein